MHFWDVFGIIFIARYGAEGSQAPGRGRRDGVRARLCALGTSSLFVFFANALDNPTGTFPLHRTFGFGRLRYLISPITTCLFCNVGHGLAAFSPKAGPEHDLGGWLHSAALHACASLKCALFSLYAAYFLHIITF